MIQERCTCDICVMMQVQYIYRYSTLLFLQVAVYRTHAAPDWTTEPAIIWLPTVLGSKEANGEQVQVWLVMDGSLSPSDVHYHPSSQPASRLLRSMASMNQPSSRQSFQTAKEILATANTMDQRQDASGGAWCRGGS